MLQVAADGGFEFETATTCDEARRTLRDGHSFDVVVTDLTLCDGNWWSVYQDLSLSNSLAEVIVVMPRKTLHPEGILAHGVHAVVGQPLERKEVLKALQAAADREEPEVAHPLARSANG